MHMSFHGAIPIVTSATNGSLYQRPEYVNPFVVTTCRSKLPCRDTQTATAFSPVRPRTTSSYCAHSSNLLRCGVGFENSPSARLYQASVRNCGGGGLRTVAFWFNVTLKKCPPVMWPTSLSFTRMCTQSGALSAPPGLLLPHGIGGLSAHPTGALPTEGTPLPSLQKHRPSGHKLRLEKLAHGRGAGGNGGSGGVTPEVAVGFVEDCAP